MPKISGTRKQLAQLLLSRIKDGPAFHDNFDGTPLTAQQALESYRQWADSWLVDDIKKLVPELKKVI